MREARPITTQNPSVGLYRLTTAFTGHRKHVALQRQSFASAWTCRLTPFRGCQNVCDARPITTQNPSVGLYRLATAFPGQREHVALQRQPFASAWPCRLTPFRGCQNLREARSITTQNPAVSLYRFAITAFPSHREHVALQRQPFASALALPRGNNPFPSLQVHSIASALPSHRPVSIGFGLAMRVRSSVGFLTLLPTFLVHRAVQMACRHTPFRGFQNVREARPITTQNPSVGLCRFATAFPGHREHVALQRQSFASAWPCRHSPFRRFQNVREARPITTQNPSVGLYRLATAFPGHREHVALQWQPFASAWPCRLTPFRGCQNLREARSIRTQNPAVSLYR